MKKSGTVSARQGQQNKIPSLAQLLFTKKYQPEKNTKQKCTAYYFNTIMYMDMTLSVLFVFSAYVLCASGMRFAHSFVCLPFYLVSVLSLISIGRKCFKMWMYATRIINILWYKAYFSFFIIIIIHSYLYMTHDMKQTENHLFVHNIQCQSMPCNPMCLLSWCI